MSPGRKSWRTGMWLAAPWAGFRSYILRGGFLDGHRGLLISRMAARTVRLKYHKLGRFLEFRWDSRHNSKIMIGASGFVSFVRIWELW